MLEEIHQPTTTTSVDLESAGNSDHMLCLPPCATSSGGGGENYPQQPHSRYDNRRQEQQHLFHPQGAHSTSASAPPPTDVQFHSQMIYSAPHHHSRRGMAAFV